MIQPRGLDGAIVERRDEARRRPSPMTPDRAGRLLIGRHPDHGPEDLAAHLARLGSRPQRRGAGALLIEQIERAGLIDRGGAAALTAGRWAAVAARSSGDALVVASGSDGDRASASHRTLMWLHPHLVIDGLLLAAEAVDAEEAVLQLPRRYAEAQVALKRAISERTADGTRVRIVCVPSRQQGSGGGGRPTLVADVETLAHAALIARHGAAWFRSVGTDSLPGSALVTVTGGVRAPGVHEVALGATIEDVVARAGGVVSSPEAILIGGDAGRRLPAPRAWRAAFGVDVPLGRGIVVVLPSTGGRAPEF